MARISRSLNLQIKFYQAAIILWVAAGFDDRKLLNDISQTLSNLGIDTEKALRAIPGLARTTPPNLVKRLEVFGKQLGNHTLSREEFRDEWLEITLAIMSSRESGNQALV